MLARLSATIAVLLAGLLLGAAAPAAALAGGKPGRTAVKASPDYFGVNYWLATEQILKREDGAVSRGAAAARGLGAEWVRGSMLWRLVEPAPPAGDHAYDWSVYDELVATYAYEGLTLRPSLLGAPLWAADPSLDAARCTTQSGVPPRAEMTGEYAGFVAAVARRYGRGGEFWSAHPDIPYEPITDYEIWNEPNMAWWWCPGPDPELFGKLFVEARGAIESVDPEATVVAGGLASVASSSRTVDVRSFLARAAAAAPGFTAAESIAVHLYGDGIEGDLGQLMDMASAMSSIGMRANVVVNEFGWPSKGSASGIPPIAEPDRSVTVGKLVKLLATSRCGISGIAPHTLVSRERDPIQGHDWFGLIDPATGAPHATGLAFAQQAERLKSGRVSVRRPSIDCVKALRKRR